MIVLLKEKQSSRFSTLPEKGVTVKLIRAINKKNLNSSFSFQLLSLLRDFVSDLGISLSFRNSGGCF